MKGYVLSVCLFALFVPSVHAGVAPPEPVEIEIEVPADMALTPTIDDLACRGRVIRWLGRGLRGAIRAPFRHHHR